MGGGLAAAASAWVIPVEGRGRSMGARQRDTLQRKV